MRPVHPIAVSLLPISCLLIFYSSAWGYRPFVSTDAAVADVKEVELELGYFNLERSKGRNNLIIPTVVLNYGFMSGVEVVGEFAVEEPARGRARVGDAGIFLKAVLREGTLQEKDGPSFAIEAGPLLPSAVKDERSFGFKGLGILSGRFAPIIYHLNLGGGVDRQHNGFVVWGTIAELPVTPRLRLVAEVNGESAKGSRGASSGLLGLIWQPPWPNLTLDAGIRKAITDAPPWTFTAGLTFGFSPASLAGK